MLNVFMDGSKWIECICKTITKDNVATTLRPQMFKIWYRNISYTIAFLIVKQILVATYFWVYFAKSLSTKKKKKQQLKPFQQRTC